MAQQALKASSSPASAQQQQMRFTEEQMAMAAQVQQQQKTMMLKAMANVGVEVRGRPNWSGVVLTLVERLDTHARAAEEAV